MARIYSRKKGKSGSTKPVKRTKPSWMGYDAGTVEQLVIKTAKTGKTAAQVGIILRDSYGIPDVRTATGKKITKILEEHKLGSALPDDLKALIRKEVGVMKHLEMNKQDVPARRGQELTESKIHRLVTYYKKSGRLPQDWAFDRSKAKTLIE